MVDIHVAAHLSVVPVPCLRDNYAYLVFEPSGTGGCFVVDPSEAQPVLDEVQRRGLTLKAILNTHHHWDHVGGNQQLVQGRDLEVIAHESDRSRVPEMTRGVFHDERTSVIGLEFRVLHIPGHTKGAVAYVFGDVCFTGDTLFCGGCGRLFEGTPAQMHDSLTAVLGELEDNTFIYCGHEYTESNLRFAQGIWSHESLERRLQEVRRRREAGEFCAGASLKTERETNPFLLCHRAELQEALEASHELAAFTELRRRKDAH